MGVVPVGPATCGVDVAVPLFEGGGGGGGGGGGRGRALLAGPPPRRPPSACASRPPQAPASVVGTKGWRLAVVGAAVAAEGRLVEIGRPSLWAMRWEMDGMVVTVRRGSFDLGPR